MHRHILNYSKTIIIYIRLLHFIYILSPSLSLSLSVYLNIYIYIYILRGAFNRFPDCFCIGI